jgi:phosphate-selective porin OprO/OprP
MKLPLRSWLTALALALVGHVAFAQEPAADPIAELARRIDALERENQALREAVMPRLPASQPQQPLQPDPQVGPLDADPELALPDVPIYAAADALAQPSPSDAPAAAAAPADGGYIVGSDLSMSASWNNGLEVSTKNKDFRVHVGGRYQFDTSWYDADQSVQQNINIPYSDGVDFRRARLRIDGTMYEVIDWAFEYDFVNAIRVRTGTGTAQSDIGVPAVTEAWWTFTHLPVVGNIRVGNHKEAIGFEHIVSSRFQPFIERSYNQDGFYGGSFNGFDPGISMFNTYAEERGTWNVGLFKTSNNVFGYNNTDGDYTLVGRLTNLPVYLDNGRQLLHLGMSVRQATTYDDRIRYRTRDAIRSGISSTWPVPADTGQVLGSEMQWINLELVAVQGPWTFQSEYLMDFHHNAQATNAAGAGVGPFVDTLFYHGGYVQLLYFLTGESDNYNRKTGAFDRVIPFENYFLVSEEDGYHCHGKGAWQVGARYNFLDLNDEGIDGGLLHNFTLGLNWFLNPNMKIQFDYFATHRDAPTVPTANFPDGDGWIHGWGCRFAHDF